MRSLWALRLPLPRTSNTTSSLLHLRSSRSRLPDHVGCSNAAITLARASSSNPWIDRNSDKTAFATRWRADGSYSTRSILKHSMEFKDTPKLLKKFLGSRRGIGLHAAHLKADAPEQARP